MIQYRLLDFKEYDRLESTFKQYGSGVPDPSCSEILVAIDTDSNEIVGFQVAQLQVHLEPIWIKEGYRTRVKWRNLFKKLLEKFSLFPTFVSLDNEKMKHIAEEMGYKDAGLKVYKKD